MNISDLFFHLFITFFLDNKHHDQNKYLYYVYPNEDAKVVTKETLPSKPLNSDDYLRIVVMSDTHDRHHKLEELPPSDLFIHCGDITMISRVFSTKQHIKSLKAFNLWLETVPAKEKIVIAGNHDECLHKLGKTKSQEILSNCIYLENNGYKIPQANIHIWGTPYSKLKSKSMNRAFQSQEFFQETINAIPQSIDILITHGNHDRFHQEIDYKLHLFGHNHNSYGITFRLNKRKQDVIKKWSICVPINDGRFRLIQRPVIIDFPIHSKELQEINNEESSDQTPSWKNFSIQTIFSFFPKYFSLKNYNNKKIYPEENES